MPPLKIFLVYLTIYPLLLCLCLKLFSVRFRIWEPFVANIACVLCVLVIPGPIGGWITLPIMLFTMRYLNDETLKNLFYPIAISRLLLIPVLLAIGR